MLPAIEIPLKFSSNKRDDFFVTSHRTSINLLLRRTLVLITYYSPFLEKSF